MNVPITRRNDIRERLFKIAITVFIIVHVTLTIAWLSPSNTLRDNMTSSVRLVWDLCGFTQKWELFAPAIRTINSHCVVMVTFDDGTATQWPMPRFEHMDYFQKFQKDKFRKWAFDNAEWDTYKEFWPDMARYIGRLHYSGVGPKPILLMMTRYQSDMPKIGSGVNRLDIPKRYQYATAFTYRFKPEDFQQ